MPPINPLGSTRSPAGAGGRGRTVAALAGLTVAGLLVAVMPAATAAPANASVDELKVNANPEPLGIDDPTPTLSWLLKSSARGVTQQRYRVGVATTAAKAEAGKPDVWDTETVTSDATSIEYDGPALKPRTRYYWSVRAWTPEATDWSEANYFETSYLDPSQWQGDWISGEPRSTTPATAEQGAADDAGLVPESTLTSAAAPGATNIKVDNVAGAKVGDKVVVGLGGGAETVTLSAVGTASYSTTLAGAASRGDTRVYLAGLGNLAAGSVISVGSGTATVTEVGTAAGSAGTLSSAAAASDTNIKVSSVRRLTAGQLVQVGSGSSFVRRTITEVGTAGATGTGLTLDSALGQAFDQNASFRPLGTGVGVSALTAAAADASPVVSTGTGLTFTPQLTNARPVGTAVRRPGASDICRPVGDSQNAGACKPVRPNYLLRKTFDVAPVTEHGKVTKARLYSTGLGWNEPSVNGELTQPDGHLNPGFTDYEDSVQYTTDDVTDLVKQNQSSASRNVVASEVAAGRYNSETVPSNHRFETAQWRALETMRADLYVTYADGTEQLVKSDDSWQTSTDGPTRYADFDNGETYDARQQIPGWNTTSFDTTGWQDARPVSGPAGKLMAMEQEKTKKVTDIKGPFPTYTTAAGARVTDVERQYAGWATIKVWDTQPGQIIRTVYVERRNDDKSIDDPKVPGTGQDGDLQLAGNLQQSYYVSDGSGTKENPEVFAPNWNFAGFQWIQIDGSGGTKLPDSVKVEVDSVQQIRTAQPEVGTFKTSTPLLNQIYDNVKGSVEGDWISGYSMDTPTYEKDGWTGDAQIILPTVANIFDIQRSMQKSAQDSVESQLDNGQVGLLIPGAEGYGYCSPTSPGTPNQYVPCGNSPSLNVFKSSGGGATPIWDAFLMVTSSEAYLRYGDTKPIETAYGAMTKYMDDNLQGGKPYSEGPGGWFERDGNLQNGKPDWTLTSGLGDWAFVTGADGNAKEGTDLNVGGFQAASSTAFTAFLASRTAEAARVLYTKTKDPKYLADAGKYETLFDNIRTDFNARWWDEDRGFYAEDSTQALRQGFQAWAIGFGLVEEKNKRALEEKLAYDVAVTRTGHAMVGFVGIRWIWPVLSDAAHRGVPHAKEALFKVAQQTTYPSYGYHIGLGYTGVGEYWEASTRTRNHQFQGSIGQWFYEELAGIKPETAGYKKISIKPLVGNEYGVSNVTATHKSINGTIGSSWTDNGAKGLTLKVQVPVNTTATVYVPGDDATKITESASGKAVAADKAPGVKLVGQVDDAIAYEVGSGTYEFKRAGDTDPETPPANAPSTVKAANVRGTYGAPTTVTAAVTGNNAPTGTVSLRSGSTVVAQAPVARGKATIKIPGTALPAGTRTLTVAYSGDSKLAGSESTVKVTIAKARTSTTGTVVTKNPTARKKVTIKAQVTATGVRPTGTVVATRGGKTLAHGTLNAAGKVNLVLPRQSAGTKKVRLTYKGGANFGSSTKVVTLRIKR